MAALGDEIRRATGGPTINEGLASHYSKTGSETLGDAAQRWLQAQPGAAGSSLNDLWYSVLRTAGHMGSLNDMKLAYWKLQ